MENVRASESEILAFFLHLLNLAEQTEHGANNKLTVDLSVQELSEALLTDKTEELFQTCNLLNLKCKEITILSLHGLQPAIFEIKEY